MKMSKKKRSASFPSSHRWLKLNDSNIEVPGTLNSVLRHLPIPPATKLLVNCKTFPLLRFPFVPYSISILSMPVRPWSRTWAENLKKIQGYDQNVLNSRFGGGVRIMRVNQLDALVLDNEVAMLLLQQFKRIFINSHFCTRETYDAFEPEAELFVWLIVYSGSILINRPTRNIFMSLKYQAAMFDRDATVDPWHCWPITLRQRLL